MKTQKVALGFLVPFSGFYITRLPISPNYILLLIGLGLIIFHTTNALGRGFRLKGHNLLLSSKKEASIKYGTYLITITAIFYFAISQSMLDPNGSLAFGIIFSFVVFFATYLAANGVDDKSIIEISEKLPYTTIPLLAYEAYYRLSNPIFFADFEAKGEENLNFYFYKVNSIMFFDSNYVGVLIVSLLFFLLYLSIYSHKKYSLAIGSLIILCGLTLSRAAIITIITFYILFRFRKSLHKYRRYLLPAGSIAALLIAMLLQEISSQDHSFQSKFLIFELTYDYLAASTPWQLLFGVGFGNSHYHLGIGAHNIFSIFLIESGLFGLLLISFFFMWVIILSGFRTGIITFPYLFVGLSAAPYASSYLFAMLAASMVIERRRIATDNKYQPHLPCPSNK